MAEGSGYDVDQRLGVLADLFDHEKTSVTPDRLLVKMPSLALVPFCSLAFRSGPTQWSEPGL